MVAHDQGLKGLRDIVELKQSAGTPLSCGRKRGRACQCCVGLLVREGLLQVVWCHVFSVSRKTKNRLPLTSEAVKTTVTLGGKTKLKILTLTLGGE